MEHWPYSASSGIPQDARAAIRLLQRYHEREWRTEQRGLLLICVAMVEEEIARLKRGEFTEEEFQNLCHNFSEDDACRFKAGCEEYQRKLFGAGE